MPLPYPSDATALAATFKTFRDFGDRIKFGTWDVTLPAGSSTGSWERNFPTPFPSGSAPQVLIGIKSATSGGSVFFTGSATATLTSATFSLVHRSGGSHTAAITFTVSYIALG